MTALPTQSPYFKSQNEAQQCRKGRLAAIELGLDAVKQSKADSKTLAALIDEYVTQFDVHPKSSSYRHLKWWRGRLGPRNPVRVTHFQLVQIALQARIIHAMIRFGLPQS